MGIFSWAYFFNKKKSSISKEIKVNYIQNYLLFAIDQPFSTFEGGKKNESQMNSQVNR